MTGRRTRRSSGAGPRREACGRPARRAARARGEAVDEPPLLAAEVAERLAPVVVAGVKRGSNTSRRPAARASTQKSAVLAAVALVPAQRRVSRNGRQNEERPAARAARPAAGRASRLQVATQPQRVRAVERAGAADHRAAGTRSSARWSPAPSPAPGTASASRKTTTSPRASSQPAVPRAAGEDGGCSSAHDLRAAGARRSPRSRRSRRRRRRSPPPAAGPGRQRLEHAPIVSAASRAGMTTLTERGIARALRHVERPPVDELDRPADGERASSSAEARSRSRHASCAARVHADLERAGLQPFDKPATQVAAPGSLSDFDGHEEMLGRLERPRIERAASGGRASRSGCAKAGSR